MWAVPHARRTDAISRRARTIRARLRAGPERAAPPIPTQRQRKRRRRRQTDPSPFCPATGRERWGPSACGGSKRITGNATPAAPATRPFSTADLSVALTDAGVSGRASAAPAAGGGPRRAGGRIAALAGTLAAVSDACGGAVSGERCAGGRNRRVVQRPADRPGRVELRPRARRQPRKRGSRPESAEPAEPAKPAKPAERGSAAGRFPARPLPAPPAKSRRCRRRRTSTQSTCSASAARRRPGSVRAP